MKQKLCLVLAFIIISLRGAVLFAQTQDVQPLPDDPRIKTGKLANGLTYYVVKNPALKGYADFAVVQKVGTVLEKPEQKGMFKMLELLSVRGTRNFTDSTIVKYLNSLGVGSKDIKFETSEDETVYSISNVPITSEPENSNPENSQPENSEPENSEPENSEPENNTGSEPESTT